MTPQYIRRPAFVFKDANTSEEMSLRKMAFRPGMTEDQFKKTLEHIRNQFQQTGDKSCQPEFI